MQGINKGLAMTTNFIWLGLCAGIVPLMVMPVSAQVTRDSTLNTTVSQSGDNFTIINGNRVGNNLFHSFSQFSVPSNGSAFSTMPQMCKISSVALLEAVFPTLMV